MPYLTTEQKASLLAAIQAAGLAQADHASAANGLNAPRTRTIQVPKPFRIADILGLLSATSQDAVMDHPLGSEVIAKINAGDRTAIGLYAATFARRSMISTAERDTILARLAETESTTVPDASLFAATLPGFYHVVDGVGYDRCTATLIAEARS